MFEGSFIAFLVAAGIALLLEVVPGAAHLWHKTPYKRLIVLTLFLVLPVLLVLSPCVGIVLYAAATCEDGVTAQLIVNALLLGLSAFAGSQGGYAASRSSGSSIRADLEWDSLDETVGETGYSTSYEATSGSWNGLKSSAADIDQRLDQLNEDLQE